MTTNVYVDGFNLYYGALKGTPYKWLNIGHLCRLLLPNTPINRIKYFTARVSARAGDPGQPVRQDIYLRLIRRVTSIELLVVVASCAAAAACIPAGPAVSSRFLVDSRGFR